jgi:hypothetical protein
MSAAYEQSADAGHYAWRLQGYEADPPEMPTVGGRRIAAI